MRIARAQTLQCPACRRPLLDTGEELLDHGWPHATPGRPCQPVPAEPTPIELDLGTEFGTARGTVRTDWTTGYSYYTLTEPRLRGTWTVLITAAADQTSIATIDVYYGEHHDTIGREQSRANNPVINNIEIAGATYALDITTIDSLDTARINCQLAAQDFESAPLKTRQRMTAVIRALLTHFTDRPDLATLHRVAARHHAEQMRVHATHRVTEIGNELADPTARLTDNRDHYRREATRYKAIANGTRSPGPAPQNALIDN
ncbi:hypothetical protein [Nocardia altamirensis]|uniref:hypothetical protein n=1 Tax=Nocardia altamirensis TaxID=472158 RepID=UPI00084078A4|nr:hypothetical protein [Nocardia altamirensis]